MCASSVLHIYSTSRPSRNACHGVSLLASQSSSQYCGIVVDDECRTIRARISGRKRWSRAPSRRPNPQRPAKMKRTQPPRTTPPPTTHHQPSVTPNNRQDGKLPTFPSQNMDPRGKYPHRRRPHCLLHASPSATDGLPATRSPCARLALPPPDGIVRSHFVAICISTAISFRDFCDSLKCICSRHRTSKLACTITVIGPTAQDAGHTTSFSNCG